MPTITGRRSLLQTAGGAAALAMAAGSARAQPAAAAAAATRPNIVFILADDMGYADPSCYGRPDISTPNIDAIAARGVRLLQAYANSAVCSATRTALITGRYQYRLPVGLEEPIAASSPPVGLPPNHPTLPSLLKQAGYTTALIGKWHLGGLPDYGPLKSGYDHFYGFRSGGVDYFRHTGRNNKDDFWDGDVPIHQAGYLTELLGQRAVELVDGFANAGSPFMISLHFNAPHWPWEGPGDAAESQRLEGRDIISFDGGSQATYRQMIEALDAQVGRVLQALTANGVAQNTIVVFTSDNGGERFADTWPFTGRKTELLEGGLRIPALISWPARLPQGRTSEQVAISMDWLPTLVAAAGGVVDPAYPGDGLDLMPMLAGEAPIASRSLFWRYKNNHQRAARIGDLKYLKILDNTFLFNVAADPLERANLKVRQKADYDRIEAAWFAWNVTMLPEIDQSFTEGFLGSQLADHFGVTTATKNAENP